MKFNGTPGPWRSMPRVGTRHSAHLIVNDAGGLIGEISSPANALLTSVAPAMLEVLHMAAQIPNTEFPSVAHGAKKAAAMILAALREAGAIS